MLLTHNMLVAKKKDEEKCCVKALEISTILYEKREVNVYQMVWGSAVPLH